jgi:hypothetical protein
MVAGQIEARGVADDAVLAATLPSVAQSGRVR